MEVHKFRLPAYSLLQVGFPSSDLFIDGPAYGLWSESNSALACGRLRMAVAGEG